MRGSIVLLFVLFFVQAFGQTNKLTYAFVDSSTYSDFILKNEKQLRKTGEHALKEDIDFYYLRIRMGISFFRCKNYIKAVPHLEQAHVMNPADTVAQWHLYHAYILSNQPEKAYDLAITFSEQLKTKVGFEPIKVNDIVSSFSSIGINIGAGITDNGANITEKNIKDDAFYAESKIQDNIYLGGLFFSNQITNRLNFGGNFNFFNVNSFGIVESNLLDTVEIKPYALNNFQTGLHGQYRFTNNLKVGASFSYFRENAVLLSSEPDIENLVLNLTEYDFLHNAYTGSVFSELQWKKLVFGTTFSIGNLSDSLQLQSDVSVVYYPFGNTNLYALSRFTWLYNYSEHNQIYHFSVGGKLYKKLWYQIGGSYGNHQNFISLSGTSTFNTIDPIHWLGEGKLDYYFSKKMAFCLNYQFQNRKSSIYRLHTDGTEENITNQYYNHLINLSISWKL